MTDTPKVVQVTLVWPDGEEYTLQHPGNLAWLRIYQSCFLGDTMKLDEFMKWACEEVIHPKKGGKLSVQDIQPARLNDWIIVLQTFLVAGELHPEFTWRDHEDSGIPIGEMEEEEKPGKISARRKRRMAPVAAGGKGAAKS